MDRCGISIKRSRNNLTWRESKKLKPIYIIIAPGRANNSSQAYLWYFYKEKQLKLEEKKKPACIQDGQIYKQFFFQA